MSLKQQAGGPGGQDRVCPSPGREPPALLPLVPEPRLLWERTKSFLMESFTDLAWRPRLGPSPFLMMMERVCITVIKHAESLILWTAATA